VVSLQSYNLYYFLFKKLKMKIRKLKIKNYKIFDDVEFDFTDRDGKTLDMVVLAGVNGCGKTTLLELIGKIFNGGISPINTDVSVTIEFTKSEVELIVNTLNRIPNLLDISYLDRDGGQMYYAWQSVFSEKEPLVIGDFSNTNENTFMFTNVIKMIEFLHKEFRFIYLPVKNDTSFENRFIETLHLDRNKKDLKKLVIKQLLEDIFKHKSVAPAKNISTLINNINKQLQGIDFSTKLIDIESEELIFESGNGQKIYFEQLSHGEQNLYFRALYLNQMHLKNALILADEPENAFHPTWQQKIVKLYQNVGENNQVFLATHSPHIMASVHPDSLFILHFNGETRKIEAMNAGEAGKYSKGVEPNRILKEIMQVEELRDFETKEDIKRLTNLLTREDFETPEALDLIEKLTVNLGRQDPFIMRLEHRLLMLRRQQQPV
jgi:predicted ATP-binding protein involved in virulence